MSIKYKAKPRPWGEGLMKYTCGCQQSIGKNICPIHGKGVTEQMIYGNDKVERLDEINNYKNNKLNEGFTEGNY